MSNIRFGFVLAATLVALLSRPSPLNAEAQPAVTSPVKVFILAGQSNMGSSLGCKAPAID
ncbi:MAG: hypothetical protein H8E44_14175 [Planctomycetes bacterium]|nr:hypothetical protein [Planctomycetota bacterium]